MQVINKEYIEEMTYFSYFIFTYNSKTDTKQNLNYA